MKTIVPNYYKNFKCTADKCKHSCCIGWEIDIDENTLLKYKSVSGEFSSKFKSNIVENEECSYFKLTDNERCPFLNKNNLCEIILNLGEGYLCQICSDHPRFRNFYSGITELGLGLCCEAATNLILNQANKVTLIEIEGDGYNDYCTDEELEFFNFRNTLFDILQDRSKTIDVRIKLFLNEFDATEFKLENKAEFFSNLEILDKAWCDLIKDLNTERNISLPYWFDNYAENLLVYFTYRHLSEALNDGQFYHRAQFIVLSYRTIEELCKSHLKKYGDISKEDVCSIARTYSSEIEYSQENIDVILNIY